MQEDRGAEGPPSSIGEPATFLDSRPSDLRQARPWHRYAHHINTFPPRLEAIARGMQVPLRGRILDYGCAEQPYRRFFPANAAYVGADLPGNPHADMHLDPDGTVPAPDEDFDAVISTQVLEHVGDPRLYLRECFRLLRPGGQLLLSTHGTFSYHPDPVDYWRWTCAGLRLEIERAGFRVEALEGIIGPVAAGLQLIQDATYYRLPRLIRPVFALVIQTVARFSDRLEGRAMRDIGGSVYAVVAVKP